MESIWKKAGENEGEGARPARVIHPLETFDWSKTRTKKLNDELEKQLGLKKEGGKATAVRLESDREKLFADFEGFAKNHDVISVSFDTVDGEGNFAAMTPEGVLIVLPGDNFHWDETETNRKKFKLDSMLGKEFLLYVGAVDRENGRIIMERPSRDSDQSPKTVIIRELRKDLEKGERPKVYGRITRVENNYALVDILGLGVISQINVRRWYKGYTRSLKTAIRENDFYEFEVYKIIRGEKGTKIYLTREDMDFDPWENVEAAGVKEGDSILVECVEKPSNKRYWWGMCDSLRGIDITGQYTEKLKKDFGIRQGIRYKCKVKSIVRGKLFLVTPYGVHPEDAQKLAKINNLPKREKQKLGPDKAEGRAEVKKTETKASAKRGTAKKEAVKGENED